MKFTIVFTLFFIFNFNSQAQTSESIDFQKKIIGEWTFSHTENERDSIVEQDVRIKNILFFADGSFTMNGNGKKMIGKFKIDSLKISLIGSFLNDKKSIKENQFTYLQLTSKKLILEFTSEVGKRHLIFLKK